MRYLLLWLSIAVQPLPFNHQLHVGLPLKCSDCHPNANGGETMGLPGANRCMACHFSIARDRPSIQKLAQYAESKQAIPWVRVYSVPSWVFWDHSTHLKAGVVCADCHGHVERMDVIESVGNATSMGGCVDCHRKANASTGCAVCHEQRN